MNFPVLYKVDKLNKERKWNVWTEKDIVFRHEGYVNEGKVKEIVERKIKGNTLRTGEEQAPREAKKLWLKKIDEGFKPDTSDKDGYKMYLNVILQKNKLNGGNRDIDFDKENKEEEIISSFRPPILLAKEFYNKKTKKINSFMNKFSKEVAFQPKLDGIRCIAYFDETVHLLSRRYKEFAFLDHIRKDLFDNFFRYNKDLVFDGEIYFHDLSVPSVHRYQFISSVAKIFRNEPHPEENKAQYWIYDLIDEKTSFKNRFKVLSKLFKKNESESIVLTQTTFRTSESTSDLESFLLNLNSHYVTDLSFEGVMLRDTESNYKNGRQSSLVKYKEFDDEEWIVVGAKKCEGGLQDGAVVWIVKNEDNTLEFEVKQTGDIEYSKELYKNRKKYYNKKINIRFIGKTEKGIPRFAQAISFVEDK